MIKKSMKMNDKLKLIEKKVIVEYYFQCSEGTIKVAFVNDKFSKCTFPFSGHYSRHQWKVLKDIEVEIEKIETQIQGGSND